MAFKVGDRVFAHADGQIKFIPNEGPSAGLPFTTNAAKSFSGEHGAKAISIMGNTILPVTVVLASAEPSFKVGFDIVQPILDLMEHVGDGCARIDYQMTITYTRSGLAPVTFILDTCIIEKGFGFESESGGGPKDELSGKCRSILIKYKGKTYDPFKLPGGALQL